MDTVAFNNNVRYLSAVVPDAHHVFEQLRDQVNWETIIWDRTNRALPRLCARSIQETVPGAIVADWVEKFFEQSFHDPKLDSTGIRCIVDDVFENRYRNGNDWLPDHSDQYGEDTHVVSLSFGATRLFRFSQGTVVEPKFYLKEGDMIIFSPQQNVDYKHGIPKQAQTKEERINMTIFCRFPGMIEENRGQGPRGNPYTAVFKRDCIPPLLAPVTTNTETDEELARALQAAEWTD